MNDKPCYKVTLVSKMIPVMNLTDSPSSPNLKADFDHDGFVVVSDLIGSQAEFDALLAAALRVIGKTRAGEWPHCRFVGRQFPPFDTENRIHGVCNM